MNINQMQEIISEAMGGEIPENLHFAMRRCKISRPNNENRIAEYFHIFSFQKSAGSRINDLNSQNHQHVLPRRSHNSKASLTCGNLHPPRTVGNGVFPGWGSSGMGFDQGF